MGEQGVRQHSHGQAARCTHDSARPVGAKQVSGGLAVAHYVCQAAAARGASSPAAAAATAQGCCQLPLEASYHCPGMWLLLARCKFASFWLATPPVQPSSSCSAPSSHSCTRSDGRHARGGVLANCAFLRAARVTISRRQWGAIMGRGHQPSQLTVASPQAASRPVSQWCTSPSR
eukprot:COSAG01_NODE_83_length_27807_cov_20.014581_1_plen_175_part_00